MSDSKIQNLYDQRKLSPFLDDDDEIAPGEKHLHKEMIINMGPQHPSTHGVLRLVLELDGETITEVHPHIGYLHRGIEKLAENRNYAQVMPLTDRLDYVSSMTNNLGYAVAVEKLMDLKLPPRANYIRMIMAEMSRICSHLLFLGCHALDIGAMTVFLYCFREREYLIDLFELICGARLTVTYIKIGGVRRDINQEFIDKLYKFTEEFEAHIEEYDTLIRENRIWLERTVGIGVIPPDVAISYGLSGPTLRGSGVNYDIRKAEPYCAYDEIDFEVPLGKNCDTYDRYRCRVEEMRQSNRIIRQCLDKLPKGSIQTENPKVVLPQKDMVMRDIEHLIHQFYLVIKGFSIPKGEVYSATEAPKGELGFYIVSNGTNMPHRVKVRAPSFVNLEVLPYMSRGHLLADIIACIGTLDIVLGECDR